MLKALFRELELDLKVNTFEDRLKVQKIVYLLQLLPELRDYLGYTFNLYLRGPYSSQLAAVYYKLPSRTNMRINVSEKAREIAKEIKEMNTSELEIVATTIAIMKYRSGEEAELSKLINLKGDLYSKEEIKKGFKKAKRFLEKFNLSPDF